MAKYNTSDEAPDCEIVELVDLESAVDFADAFVGIDDRFYIAGSASVLDNFPRLYHL